MYLLQICVFFYFHDFEIFMIALVVNLCLMIDFFSFSIFYQNNNLRCSGRCRFGCQEVLNYYHNHLLDAVIKYRVVVNVSIHDYQHSVDNLIYLLHPHDISSMGAVNTRMQVEDYLVVASGNSADVDAVEDVAHVAILTNDCEHFPTNLISASNDTKVT